MAKDDPTKDLADGFDDVKKSVEEAKSRVKDFHESLTDIFDISKQITNQYDITKKSLVNALGEYDKTKEAIKSIGAQISENKIEIESMGRLELKLLSQKKKEAAELLNIEQHIKKTMGTLGRVADDMKANEKLRKELSEKITKNNEEQVDLAKQMAILQETRNKSGENTAHFDEMIADLKNRQNLAALVGNSIVMKNISAELKHGALTDERGKLIDRLNKQFVHELIHKEKIKAIDEELNELSIKKSGLESKNLKLEGDLNNEALKASKLLSEIQGLTAKLNFWKLIKLGYDRFVELDKAAEEFRKQTGFSATQMKDLRKDAEALNVEFASMGVSIEVAYKSAKALTDVFGRTSLVSKESLKNVSLLSVNLGVAEEHSAAVLATFEGLGGASEQAAMNIIKVGAGISEKAGVPFKLVMQDVANASEQTLASLGANPSKLMKSAIAARAMGAELNKLVSSQRKLLDFSTSINDEMEASAMLGKNVNFQMARQLAFEGRVEDAAKATLETVKNAGDFNKMNVYQREALAKASGMELKDLTKMLAVEAKRDAILTGSDEGKKATLKAQEAELANLKKMNDLSSEDLVKQNEKVLMQQKMQGMMTKLKNIMDSITIAFADILEPIITPLIGILIPAFKLIGMLARTFGFILKSLLTPITALVEGIGWFVEQIDGATSSFSGFGDGVKTFFKWTLATVGTLAALGGAIGYFMFGGSVSGLLKNIGSVFAKAKDGIVSVAKGGVGGVKDKIGSFFGKGDVSKVTGSAASAEKVKSSAGTGIKTFLKDLSAGLKAMKGADVLLGALNLIPASIGLVVMIPGVLGAKLLSMVDGEKLSSALEGMAKGLKKMAKGDVLLGTGSLTAAALAFAIMTVGAIGLAAVAFLGGPAGVGLELLASGLKAMGKGTVMAGIVSMGLLALAFAGIAYGFKQFAELEWETLAKAGVAIVGLGLAAAGLGYIAPLVIAGSIAIGILGLAIGVFGIGVTALAEGLPVLADGIEKMITPLTSLASTAGGLYLAAGGIGAIGIALAAFGAGSAVAGIGNFVGGLLGGDPIKKIKELSSMGSQLQLTADSIQKISTSMSNFGAVDAFTSSVDKLTLSLSKLNDQVESMSVIKLAALSVISTAAPTAAPTTEAAPTDTGVGALGGKLDELISLMRSGGIAVNLDGRKVSSAMASSGRD
jgi:hypothetical protein